MSHIQQSKNSMLSKLGELEPASTPRADSKALQEIIDILKYPFQVSCKSCKGLGYVKNGVDCKSCDGTGMVLEDFFK